MASVDAPGLRVALLMYLGFFAAALVQWIDPTEFAQTHASGNGFLISCTLGLLAATFWFLRGHRTRQQYGDGGPHGMNSNAKSTRAKSISFIHLSSPFAPRILPAPHLSVSFTLLHLSLHVFHACTCECSGIDQRSRWPTIDQSGQVAAVPTPAETRVRCCVDPRPRFAS